MSVLSIDFYITTGYNYIQSERKPVSHPNNRAESTTMTILEQLWNGTFHPFEIKKPSFSQYNDLLTTAHESEQKLLSLLTEEGKELYNKLTEARTELYSIDEYEIYTNGFRTGAKLMLEIINTDE